MEKRIRIKVHPHSKKEDIIIKSEDRFEIFVKEEARGGKANQSVIRLLARHYGVEEKNVCIVKGSSLPSKHVVIYM